MKRLLLFNLATDADDSILGFTTSWIRALASHAETIDVISMRTGRIDVPEKVYVYSVGKELAYSEARRAIEFYRILFRLLRKYRYDGCFAHMMPLFAVMAAPFLKIKKIPIVLWYAHKSVTNLLRLATCLVDRVVTSNQKGFRIASPKVHIIGHGIDTARFVPKEYQGASESFTVVTVGRISPIKRLDLLIEAIHLLYRDKRCRPLQLNIVGGALTDRDRHYMEALKRQIHAKDLDSHVNFIGSIPFERIVGYYQQADCLVNLSPDGAIDKAVLEAMSCGLIPVICNQSFREVLGAELSERWVVGAEPSLIKERFLEAASLSQEARQQIGQRLRQIVIEKHSLQKWVRQLVDILASLRREKLL
ncbi:hypothetical protein CSB45_00245 [candidate division KSB3 bacterium]|uniref:Glycosyl transferase family 1 domain-containing protein n=1 Tax=candidate division KSB3 bacterium TaxID=2044937 RepID=A0A2G6EE77_9BACT|nr:MAG: hypothetical protein CSB45_00245 [candidate division KSB3 bacterium]PIE28374.1 MAG: hypothetical protein CSA57_14095 [candidate division KSB3 bacterium]